MNITKQLILTLSIALLALLLLLKDEGAHR